MDGISILDVHDDNNIVPSDNIHKLQTQQLYTILIDLLTIVWVSMRLMHLLLWVTVRQYQFWDRTNRIKIDGEVLQLANSSLFTHAYTKY